MSIDTVWQEALQYIQEKVPKQVYDTWFLPVRLDQIDDATVHIGVPNKFFGEWLNTHYGSLLVEAMTMARGGEVMAVAFTVRENGSRLQSESQTIRNEPRGVTQAKPRRGIQLNPK